MCSATSLSPTPPILKRRPQPPNRTAGLKADLKADRPPLTALHLEITAAVRYLVFSIGQAEVNQS
jgi:hypothetical protein